VTSRDLREEIAAAARELAQEFAEVLPARVEALASALAEAKAAPESEALRDQLVLLAHRLAGTAGSHGFDAVGEEARAIENLVVDQGAAMCSDERHWRELEERMAAVRAEARLASKGLA
jgi:HPt (histidine-containing phosphotransfer) domain-containing protein